MKSNELSKYLEKLLCDSGFRSILIDGPWGCGKTYEIQNYIKKNKKKCIYVSLFGLETIDEINTEIYKQSHKCRIKMARLSNVLTKAVSPVKIVNNVADALAFQLNNIDTTKIKKSKVIILDDLERLSKGIEYRNLVGYINRLFMNQARVVCLVSLKSLENDGERKKDFLEFREKVFDACLTINNTAQEVFDNLFKDFEIPNCELIYPLFNNNIRIAKNISLFYKDVITQINSLKIKTIKLTNFELLKVCAYTILLAVVYNKEKPSFKEDESFQKNYYEELCAEYGENIANGISKYFSRKQEPENDNRLKNFTDCLIKYFLYREFDDFAKIITINDAKELDILECHPFYFSEENKKRYFDTFQTRVMDSESWDDKYEKCIRAIYSDTDFCLDDNVVKKLAKLRLMSEKRLHIDEGSIAFDFFPGGINNSIKIQRFITIYKEEYNSEAANSICNAIKNTIETKNYRKTIELLEKIRINQDKQIKIFLVKNNFFIPNLSSDISEIEWTFCHEMADTASKLELKNEYITVIKKIYKNAKDKRNTLKVRLWALIFYKIDNTFKENDLIA